MPYLVPQYGRSDMRFVLASCLCLVPAASFAANPDCAVFGEIVNDIVVERQDGKTMNPAMEAVAKSHSAKNARFVPTIPYLAEWVYSLPQDQLTVEAGSAFETQCQSAPKQ